MDKKYNEFKVRSFKTKTIIVDEGTRKEKKKSVLLYKDGLPVPDKMELTERGHVMITEKDASWNNSICEDTKLWYELSEEQPKKKKNTEKKETVEKIK